MGSFDRSKKKIQVWKKAIFHFSLCFVMGLFTGLAPTNSSTSSSSALLAGGVASNETLNTRTEIQILRARPVSDHMDKTPPIGSLNRNLLNGKSPTSPSSPVSQPRDLEGEREEEEEREKLVIIITTTSGNNPPLQGALVRRLGNTLRLVRPPLVWIVVQPQSDSLEIIGILRKTGIMIRHLVSKENFTDPAAETDHQRNLALNHIEHHRLDGIVHFASLTNFYDLHFFEEIRKIEVFGTWPIAMLWEKRQKVVMEGPICECSEVIGWHLLNKRHHTNGDGTESIGTPLFGFNSSVLWDPERWGRASSVQDTSQDSLRFIQQIVLEDESKLRGIRDDCSKIMLWHLTIPNLG